MDTLSVGWSIVLVVGIAYAFRRAAKRRADEQHDWNQIAAKRSAERVKQLEFPSVEQRRRAIQLVNALEKNSQRPARRLAMHQERHPK